MPGLPERQKFHAGRRIDFLPVRVRVLPGADEKNIHSSVMYSV